MIDKGSVSDPVKWASSGNNQDMEIRFWTDATNALGGGIGATYYDLVDATNGNSLYTGTTSTTGVGGTYSHPYASVQGTLTGAVNLSAGVNIVAGTNDVLNLTVDGVPRSIALPAGAYTFAGLQTQLQSQLGPYGVTVGASGNNLLLTSNSVAGTSGVTVTLPASNGATALLGAATGGYAYQYGSSATINLKSLPTDAQTFDYGAAVMVSGSPVTGDIFTIKGSTDPVTSNGYFVTDEKTTTAVNTGSGIIGAGEVLDHAKWNSPLNSRNLEVRFWQDPTSKTLYYDLIDKETEKSLFTNTTSTAAGSNNTYTHAFKAGDSISFAGLDSAYSNSGGAGDFGVSVTIQGTPASGDAFSVTASSSQSVFDTLGNLINALETGAPVGTAGNTELANKIGQTLTDLSQVEDNFLRVRASIGSRLAEVDDLDNVGQNLDLQYSETLSRLQDLDYADAITRLNRQQMELQAAQQSFAKISQLSLFNYL
ncbi:MAG: hypothetical protein A2045_05490 [Rhodocyclales bacterium GWA2_65_20]|nr:MAG: hypothetical protein A2045_05490 [Rhodocyclales bacterium GWA2_65_20]